MKSELTNAALRLAYEAHLGQTRRDKVTPYILHPVRVALMVAKAYPHTEEMHAAALLHDLIEDCGYTAARIRERLPSDPCVGGCIRIVEDLTNEYTSARYPHWNRARRKSAEAVRLAKAISNASKIVKLADLVDNLEDMDVEDGFACIFASETERLLAAIGDVSNLYHDALEALAQLGRRIAAHKEKTNG